LSKRLFLASCPRCADRPIPGQRQAQPVTQRLSSHCSSPLTNWCVDRPQSRVLLGTAAHQLQARLAQPIQGKRGGVSAVSYFSNARHVKYKQAIEVATLQLARNGFQCFAW